MYKTEKAHYIITLIATLLAMTLIVVYTFGTFYELAKEDAVNMGEIAVKERAETLDNFLVSGMESMNITGQAVDYMLAHGSDVQAIEEYLTETSEYYANNINENFTGIYGYIDDTYVDGVGWIPEEGYVPTERTWYTEAMKGEGKVVFVPPYVDAQTGQVIFSLSRMLSNGKDVISLDLVMDDIQVLAEGIHLNENGYGFVMDRDGLIVAHSNQEERGKKYILEEADQYSDMEYLIQKILYGTKGAFPITISGEECVVFVETVEDNWYVVMVINSADLFEKVHKVLITNVILSLIVFMLVSYFCTTNYHNKRKAQHYSEELKKYQLTLEERVLEQTEEIRKRTEELICMQEDVIEGMATLIESRDGNTGEHVRNTKRYVSLIVKRMKEKELYKNMIGDTYVNKLVNAAALHDVGKITISDMILNKPARLDAKEYEIMKTHSTEGGKIVHLIFGEHADEEMVKIAGDVAKYHHERWDGKGYPEGLKEEEIPLAARIMAVADVFDALVSKRVYKEKIPAKTAFSMIEQESGFQFDPLVVETFLEQKDEILAGLEE
ncbi:MAG: HD domain-containing protein [Lachnospiraceae bacterium]|nr:HD domain-containing protein [Lachnospiraceae bacterium]